MSKPQILVVSAVDRQNSSFELEGSRDDGNPIFLNAPNLHFICSTSKVAEQDEKGVLRHRPIRYIHNCDTIYVDEQKKLGVEPNPQIDKKYLTLENGDKTIIREGSTIALYDFFAKHENNVSNPNRPSGAGNVFEVIDTESKAVEQILDVDNEIEALQTVNNLILVRGASKADFVYDEEKVDTLSKLFGIVVDSTPEKVNNLFAIARQNPNHFVSVIGNKRNTIRTAVQFANEMNVLTFIDNGAAYGSTGATIMKFKSKDRSKQIDELVDYLLSPGGAPALAQLHSDLEKAKQKELNLA
jgi:hypothetical protein